MGLFSALNAFQVPGQFQSGRRAFLAKKYNEALQYFQKAAQGNPDYAFVARNFREGIWTFIGRAQYNLGQLAETRRSLERAVIADSNDCLAKLFLGLIFARGNDLSNGQREIENGLKALHDWIEQANSADPFNASWDPRREIRAEIEKTLAVIADKKVDWQKLIASCEWLGQRMEEEIDLVRRDESRRLNEET
jgi:tetratricopeptide (TPR) repeat protein